MRVGGYAGKATVFRDVGQRQLQLRAPWQARSKGDAGPIRVSLNPSSLK
jgi:hypothetical protein